MSVETDEYLAMLRRMIRAAGKRVGDADEVSEEERRVKVMEKCSCGASVEVEGASASELMDGLDAWYRRHESHALDKLSEPRVKGTSATAERSTRPYPGYEQVGPYYGPDVPTVNARVGFVPNGVQR
jgi:hypothetical protein